MAAVGDRYRAEAAHQGFAYLLIHTSVHIHFRTATLAPSPGAHHCHIIVASNQHNKFQLAVPINLSTVSEEDFVKALTNPNMCIRPAASAASGSASTSSLRKAAPRGREEEKGRQMQNLSDARQESLHLTEAILRPHRHKAGVKYCSRTVPRERHAVQFALMFQGQVLAVKVSGFGG